MKKEKLGLMGSKLTVIQTGLGLNVMRGEKQSWCTLMTISMT